MAPRAHHDGSKVIRQWSDPRPNMKIVLRGCTAYRHVEADVPRGPARRSRGNAGRDRCVAHRAVRRRKKVAVRPNERPPRLPLMRADEIAVLGGRRAGATSGRRPGADVGAFLLNGTGLWLGRPQRRVIGDGEGLLLTAHGLRYWRSGRAEHHSWAGFRCVRVEYLDTRALSPAQRRREWLLLLPSALLSPGATGPPRATPVAVTVWFPAPGDERSIQSLPFWREPLSELEQAAVIDTFALFRRDPVSAISG